MSLSSTSPRPRVLAPPSASPFSPKVEEQYQVAVLAAQAGRWQQSADAYLNAYLIDPAVRQSPWGWLIWSGFTCILRDNRFPAVKHHLTALATVAENGPILHRAYAQFTRGLVRFDARDREAAARDYRRCIDIVAQATAAERAEEAFNNGPTPTGALGILAYNVGVLLDDIAKEARDNVEGMKRFDQQPFTDWSAMANAVAEAERRGMDPQKALHKMGAEIGPVGDRAENAAAAQDAISRLGLGGDNCDRCGAEAAKLTRCARCQLACYCSRECQKAAWKDGHKAACREPGQFEVGDKVLVQGLERSPELNGSIVEVRAAPRESDGRIAVSIIGGEKAVAMKPQNLRRLRPAA